MWLQMKTDNTLFYCLGVIIVFIIISVCKNGSNKSTAAIPQDKTETPEPTEPRVPDISKNETPVPDAPTPSQPENTTGSGGLAGSVLNKKHSSGGGRSYTS